jgi:hypothetical protein
MGRRLNFDLFASDLSALCQTKTCVSFPQSSACWQRSDIQADTLPEVDDCGDADDGSFAEEARYESDLCPARS